MNNFYKELPEGYKEYKIIDAKDKKTVVWFNIINLLLTILAIIPFTFILKFDENFEYTDLLIFSLVFLFSMIIYFVLHELTHGLMYKIFTKEKLTFGLTLSVAFCGVPHIYVSKKTALFSVLAPFVLYTIILIPVIFIVPNGFIRLAMILLFGLHFGGCVGDLYVTLILLKSEKDVLMNDTGPKQTFYKLEKRGE